MNIAHKSTFVLGGRHLLGIEGLSYSDIIALLSPRNSSNSTGLFVSNLVSDRMIPIASPEQLLDACVKKPESVA